MPMWVGMGHAWKYYTEFKCLLNLDLKVSTMEADTTISDSPFQFFIVLLNKLLAYTRVLADIDDLKKTFFTEYFVINTDDFSRHG